jgi:hypothetical protein
MLKYLSFITAQLPGLFYMLNFGALGDGGGSVTASDFRLNENVM